MINVLPQALDTFLQPALFSPHPAAGGNRFTGTLTPGQLALPARFSWEAELFARG